MELTLVGTFLAVKRGDNGESALIYFMAALFGTLSVAVLALAVRLRRARGIEREQMKWLLFAGALFVLMLILDFVWESRPNGRAIYRHGKKTNASSASG